MKKTKRRYHFKETIFKELMTNRVSEILLVCSHYDKFMLEEDGRIDEMLFQEYVSLNLRYPPRFTQVSTAHDAFSMLSKRPFDLVMTMLNIGDINAIDLAQRIKAEHPHKPIIVLTPVSTRDTMLRLQNETVSSIDYIFSWQGNPNILLAMVKLVEDRMNLDYDVKVAGVQTIILVEDSVQFYSSYLPLIYRAIFQQALLLMKEGLNEWQQTMRMRCRPKMLLARNYEEAILHYETHKDHLLGIITDVSYNREGKRDKEAGIKLCSHIRAENQELPIVLQSSQHDYRWEAQKHRATFIHKHSQTLLKDLRGYIRANYGFGDFVFRDPKTLFPLAHARDLRELQHRLADIPTESLVYHAGNNDISKWLKARALFSLANFVKPVQLSDFETIQASRDFLIEAIKEHRRQEGRGTIADFRSDRFDEMTFFSRIGSGSLGGKGRGLAFIDMQLKKHRSRFTFEGVTITIPRTVVLAADVFDDFMEQNNLFEIGISDRSDEKILQHFLSATLPMPLQQKLRAVLSVIHRPLAVRSSSLLEDSHFQPFAGIYNTYMLPNNHPEEHCRFQDLSLAIKAVYASTYFRRSKDYMRATNNMVEEEKMAVIVQELTGNNYGKRFYPNIAGVARSLNYYPVEQEKPNDGVANIAVGLGRTVVEGRRNLRFCPKYPKKIMQLSDVSTATKSTQHTFYALDMAEKPFNPGATDGTNLLELDIQEAIGDGSLKLAASTYDFENNMLRDGAGYPGRKVITFAGILKYGMFPLAEILSSLLAMGQEVMNTPIEIEFAVNLDTPPNTPKVFSFLQIRPIVEGAEQEEILIDDQIPENTLILANKAMGNGVYGDLRDVVYVKPSKFNPAHTEQMAAMIGELNKTFDSQSSGYILVVPGRLGSMDPWLGIPTAWSQITQARVIVEVGLENFQVDPSQGTHFFQNMTSLRNAYLTINPHLDDGIFNEPLLEEQECIAENSYIKHVRFPKPLIVKIDGRTSRGIIYPQP